MKTTTPCSSPIWRFNFLVEICYIIDEHSQCVFPGNWFFNQWGILFQENHFSIVTCKKELYFAFGQCFVFSTKTFVFKKVMSNNDFVRRGGNNRMQRQAQKRGQARNAEKQLLSFQTLLVNYRNHCYR